MSKTYKTILADPPWEMNQTGTYGAIHQYPLMTMKQIMEMPIADLADPDGAHLWLWVTNGVIPYVNDVLNAWGFTYRSIFTWVKPRLGLGVYLRNASEQLIFATRGKNIAVRYRSQPTWAFAPVQEHSHKPEEQYAIIERVSPGPYLELFARRRQPGWDVWGNEIESDIEIPGYPVPKVRSLQTLDKEDAPDGKVGK